MMRRRVLMGMAAMGYGKFVGAFIQLALVPTLALHWGLALYGQWLMLSAIPIFLAASDFGFSTAAGNRIIAEVAREQRDEALATFQSAWVMIASISAIVALVAAAVCLFLPGDVLAVDDAMGADDARLVLAVLCLFGLVSLQMFLFAAVARSEGRQAQSISLIATTQLIEGLAVLGVVFLGGQPLEAALAYLIVRFVALGSHIALSRRYAPWMKIGSRHAYRDRIRELFRPAIAAMVVPLAQAGYLQGTSIAVGAAGGAAMVPLYTSLRTISRIGLQLMATFVVPLMPEFTAAYARGDQQLVARIGGLVGAINAVFGVCFGLGVILFGSWFLDVWTNGAIQPPPLMITLVGLGLILSVVWNPLSSLLLAINRHETYSFTLVAVAAATVALTYVLVEQMGVSGAAAANLVLEVIMLTTVAWSFRKHVGRPEFGREAMLAALPNGLRMRLSGK